MNNLELSRASERGWRGMPNGRKTLLPLGREGYPQETEGPWGRRGCEHTPTNYSWLRRKRAKVGAVTKRAVNPSRLIPCQENTKLRHWLLQVSIFLCLILLESPGRKIGALPLSLWLTWEPEGGILGDGIEGIWGEGHQLSWIAVDQRETLYRFSPHLQIHRGVGQWAVVTQNLTCVPHPWESPIISMLTPFCYNPILSVGTISLWVREQLVDWVQGGGW